MKTLLPSLFLLQFVLIMSEGACNDSKISNFDRSPVKRTASTIKLPNFEGGIDLPTYQNKPASSHEEFMNFWQNKDYIESLQNRFDTHLKEKGVTEIDISYPSFLNFVSKKCLELRKSDKIKELIDYIVNLINLNMEANINDVFDQLFVFETKSFFPEGVLKDRQKEIQDQLGQAINNLTVQQRIKSLLILRKISDLGLSDNFGFRKLQRIKLKLGGDIYTENVAPDNGEYLIALAISSQIDHSIKISINDQNKHINEKKKADAPDQTDINILCHELSHLYHKIIVNKNRLGWDLHIPHEISSNSWQFEDFTSLLSPFRAKKVQERARLLLLKYFKNSRGSVNYIVQINSENPFVNDKVFSDIQEICSQYIDNYLNSLISELIAFYQEFFDSEWSTLEEILTIIGIAPIDIEPTKGKIERFRVIDRQNESAVRNRSGGTYRVLHANNEYLTLHLKEHLKKKQFAIKDDSIVSDIMDVMLQALNESDYELYANGDGIEQKSIKMQESESNFLQTFDYKANIDNPGTIKKIMTLLKTGVKGDTKKDKRSKNLREKNASGTAHSKTNRNITRKYVIQ